MSYQMGSVNSVLHHAPTQGRRPDLIEIDDIEGKVIHEVFDVCFDAVTQRLIGQAQDKEVHIGVRVEAPMRQRTGDPGLDTPRMQPVKYLQGANCSGSAALLSSPSLYLPEGGIPWLCSFAHGASIAGGQGAGHDHGSALQSSSATGALGFRNSATLPLGFSSASR